MEIIKAIVNEFPDGCVNCPLLDYEQAYCHANGNSLISTKKDRDKLEKIKGYRPDWCPLVRKDLYEMEIIQNFVGIESEE